MAELKRKEALEYLKIPEKHFDNYIKNSKEINSTKISGQFRFQESELDRWKNLRDCRTVYLTMEEYQKCFILATQMAYTKKPSAGTGIRGVRSEMQVADDWILGIMAEFGLKKFLKETYGIKVELDTEPHPKEGITAQDVVSVDGREPKLKVAMKASKTKNCWIVLDPLEYEDNRRKSDVYFFTRVDLPSDHLFRILREHSFFDIARKKLSERVTEQDKVILKISEQLESKRSDQESLKNKLRTMTPSSEKNKIKEKIRIMKQEIENLEKKSKSSVVFRNIEPLPKQIPIWMCGFTKHGEFDKVRSIPGQNFDGDRYVKSVAGMNNSDTDWQDFVKRL